MFGNVRCPGDHAKLQRGGPPQARPRPQPRPRLRPAAHGRRGGRGGGRGQAPLRRAPPRRQHREYQLNIHGKLEGEC